MRDTTQPESVVMLVVSPEAERPTIPRTMAVPPDTRHGVQHFFADVNVAPHDVLERLVTTTRRTSLCGCKRHTLSQIRSVVESGLPEV